MKAYNAAQVEQILGRAVELQIARDKLEHGMSMAELEKIAGEAGLELSLVRQSARSLDRTERRDEHILLGVPLSLRLEARVPRKLSSSQVTRLAQDLEGFDELPGKISEGARGLTWHRLYTGPRAHSKVSIISVEGETGIEVDIDMWDLLTMSIIVCTCAPMLVALNTFGAWWAMLLLSAGFGMVCAWPALRYQVKRRIQQHERLLERLVERIESLEHQPSLEPTRSAPEAC